MLADIDNLCSFVPSVDADMSLQITTRCELCTTGITLLWFIPSVDMDVF